MADSKGGEPHRGFAGQFAFSGRARRGSAADLERKTRRMAGAMHNFERPVPRGEV